MSIIIKELYTVTFISKEDKTKAFGYLIHSNIPFKVISLNTITIQKNVYDTLKEQGINFK